MKLSYGQLWAVLFLFRIFTVMCSDTDYSVNAFLGSAAASAIQFAVTLPLLKLTEGIKRPSEKWGLLFALYFIFTGMTAAAGLYELAGTENIAVSNVTAAVLAGVTVLFISRYALSAFGRAAVIVSGLFIFFMVILTIMVSGNIEPDNIALSYDSGNTVTGYIIKDIAGDTLFPVLPVLALFTEKKRSRAVKIYFVSRIILSAVTVFLGASVIGRVSLESDYPFFSICSFSGSAGVQRTDVMFIVSCVLSAVIFIAVCIRIASFFLSEYFRKSRLAVTVCTIAGGFLFRGENVQNLLLAAFLIFLAADILFIMQIRKEDKRKEKAV